MIDISDCNYYIVLVASGSVLIVHSYGSISIFYLTKTGSTHTITRLWWFFL